MLLDDNHDLQKMLAKQKAIKDVTTLMTILEGALPDLEKSIQALADQDREQARALYANEIRATAFRVHLSVTRCAIRRAFLLRTTRGWPEDLVQRYDEELERIGRLYRFV